MHKITTNLWFDDQAEQAAEFYASIFPDSSIGTVTRYGREGHDIHGRDAGSVMTVEFQIMGQQFVALNGGPHFTFNESISFIVNCDTQAEVDFYWERLSEGGDPSAQQCGWLKDRYGLSWQIVPVALTEMIGEGAGSERSERVLKAMFAMQKLDIATLRRAYDG